MLRLLRFGAAPLRDRSGATAIEYALLAGLIAAGLISAAGVLGDRVAGLFGSVNGAMEAEF